MLKYELKKNYFKKSVIIILIVFTIANIWKCNDLKFTHSRFSYMNSVEIAYRDLVTEKLSGRITEDKIQFVMKEYEQLAYIVDNTDYSTEYDENRYSDKDFKVPSERMLAYYKLQQNQTKRINEDAEKRSIFASFFRSSKMKYGKRIAYYQIDNEHDNFKVQEYTHFHESTELPQAFLNDPVTFYSKRMNYLNRKNKNAINN